MFPAFTSRAICGGGIGSTDRLKTASSFSPLCRLLLAHDDERMCQFTQDILERCAEISILGRASDSNKAVALSIVHQPDVILIDVNLPSFHRAEAARRIKEISSRTVVIGIAEHFTPSIYSAIRTAGAAAFLCKNELLGIHDTIVCALEQSTLIFANSSGAMSSLSWSGP